jgi:predicted phosphoribosyltransferase
VTATRALQPKRIVVAVPTSAVDSVTRLEGVADRVIALATPEPYFGVGAWYEEFHQLDDEEVLRCLDEAASAYARRNVPEREHGSRP